MKQDFNYLTGSYNPRKKRRSLKTKPEFKAILPKETVLNVVCNHFQTSYNEINTTSRKTPYPYIRQVAMLFLKEFSLPTLTAIGEMFGRDHTTVMHGLATLQDRMDTEESVYREVNYLKDQLLSIN